ncbi:MAG: Unknown protein [uncultured Sulfurovum sp.]|uniref:DUF302 domain-containing protein n=1 Tax=uncultured Sulfurovum sp. TaxID=269237 RepID=A0A6S6S516_9BACT|nr:MAG: Unknown protein [uncultured Sulfurovum sp.]
MNVIIKNVLIISLLLTGAMANEDIKIFTADNKDGKITTQTIQTAFEKVGFVVTANRDMNTPFKKQFKNTTFDVYNLFTFYKKDTVLALAKKYEHIGLFAPMSLSIYTKKGENKISISTLSSEAMAKIMNIPKNEQLLLDLRALVVKAVENALPKGKAEKLNYGMTKASGELVTTYSMEVDSEEWEDELDDLKMEFEGELATNGFVVAGHNNFGDDFEDAKYEGYDFYEVYSVCKLPVIFNIAKTRPEAGAFAPCSLYFSKKKNENKINMAFPSVYNWMSSLAISDKKDIEVLEDAQKKMNSILSELIE